MDNFLFGVNFNCFRCATYQNRENMPEPPDNYIDDSFKIFHEEGINCIRVLIYWESYEHDPHEFFEELDHISSTAYNYNVLCIYDNHQWECSSYLGYGIGFPTSLLKQYFHKDDPKKTSMNPPINEDLRNFWNNWWDRKFVAVDGKDGWDTQFDYLEKIVKRVKDNKSTLGFEILNEPQVHRWNDFKIVGNYHKYILEKLASITDKAFFLCWTNSSISIENILPGEQIKIRPSSTSIKNNLFYDIHPYPPSIPMMTIYKTASLLMDNIPMYAGEFNSGIKKGVTVDETDFVKYVKLLKQFSANGCALWQWSYTVDNDHPAFNLTEIINGKISPNNTFRKFVRSIKPPNI
jgi:hypothetical protein